MKRIVLLLAITVAACSGSALDPPAADAPIVVRGLGPLMRQMVDADALDPGRLEEALVRAGHPMTTRQRRVLHGADLSLTLTPDNADFLLNGLWTLGLVGRSPILTRGPMVTRSRGQVGRFASTGGWRLGPRPATALYATMELIPLASDERERLARVAGAVFRPCCDNPTDFPDCNHGMAMLGLLTLLAGQGAGDVALFDAARAANGIWFPQPTRHIEAALREKETPTARAVVGPRYSSATGHRRLMESFDGATPGDGGAPSPC